METKSFDECNKIEELFYKNTFRPYLIYKGYDLIWIRYDEKNIIHKEIQKKYDIDIILDDGIKNVSLSLKTVRNVYNKIFFETISNMNINSLGWGHYSKSDYVIYTFGYPDKIISYMFKLVDIHKLNLENYITGYGKTYDIHGNLLYKTEGKLIPLLDFENKIIDYNRVKRL